jgi:hypothetical protein
VATYSTGMTATWGSTPFQEVTGLSWTYGSSSPKGRSSVWTDDLGSVSIQCLGAANVTSVEYGKRKDLAITGGGANLTVKALYESLSATPELNGITRYTVTFKILDG